MLLNVQLTPLTRSKNLEFWNRFAGPDDSAAAELPELKEFMLSQLESFVWFHDTTPNKITEAANDSCAFFQYIRDRIAPTLAKFRQ